jgi:hypothetical protein
MPNDPPSAPGPERLCADADDWAALLEDWGRRRPTDPDAGDAAAISGMLRALVKSVRLSELAEADAQDREILCEELANVLEMARSLSRANASVAKLPSPGPLGGRTLPPPPGFDPKILFANAEPSADVKKALARVTLVTRKFPSGTR